MFLAAGGFLFLFWKAAVPRGIGQVSLAFAFLLTAMDLIGGAARGISTDPAVVDLFAALGALPLLLFAGAVLLTFLLQSSTASVAVGIGLAGGGQVTVEMLLLWVLGANVGLCLTVLAAGWAGADSRRLGVAVLLIKLPLAAVALTAILVGGPEILPAGELARQAAWTHTLFNLAAGLAVPFAVRIGRVAERIVPVADPGAESGGLRLDPLLLQHPSLAVNAALREALRIFDGLHVMRETLVGALRKTSYSPHLQTSLAASAAAVADIRASIIRFLDALDDDSLDADDARMKDALDDFMREVPVMLRTLQRDLPEEARKFLDAGPQQRAAALPILQGAADRCGRLTETVARMLMQEKPELGDEVRERKRENSAWMIAAKRDYAALPGPVWEIIDDFQQINRRLGGVAYVYCREQPGAGEL